MKVLHIETGMQLYGGAQQVAYLLDGLHALGVDNLLTCPPGSAISARFERGPVTVRELACGGDLDIGFYFRLKRLIRTSAPDIVHLHSRRGADVMGSLAARKLGVPCVLSRRVDNPESRFWTRRKYALPDRVVAISQGIGDVLIEQGLPAEKLRVVRSAVDARPWQAPANRRAFADEFGVPEDALWIGVVAQLIERKGHRVLFDAIRKLSMKKQIRVICFGKGKLREALERESSDLGDIVRFAGFRSDLSRWIGAVDILAHPALMEGLGVSLLQASAAGVPIVASQAGGMPEAVADEVSGLLVKPGDADQLADALTRLIRDPALRKQLGDQGRQRIEEQFSVQKMVEGNLAVYRELLGR